VNDIFNFHPLVNLLHISLFLPKWYKILQPPTTQMQHHCPSSTSNLPHTSSIPNKSFETYGLVLCNEGNCLGNCKDRHLLYIQFKIQRPLFSAPANALMENFTTFSCYQLIFFIYCVRFRF
jgi:hypothetical protein